MDLLPGIALIDTTRRRDPDRVALSAGVLKCSSHWSRGQYREGAVIPREPWRVPKSSELQTLGGTGPTAGPGSWVSIVTVPEQYIAAWRPLQGASLRVGESWEKINEYVTEHADMDALLAYSEQFSLDGVPQGMQKGVRANSPGLRTVTMHDGAGILVGLHVDNWFNAPIVESHLSPNRIAINLGSEDRFLLFINLPLRRIWELVHGMPCVSPVAVEPDLLDRFWTSWSSYPVVRLRIRPGEVYVAPTENIVHDGSTAGMQTWDIYLTILGHFASSPESRPSRTLGVSEHRHGRPR